MRYKLAIFDLDGTILDTLGDLAASGNYALRSCGLPERSTDEVRQFVGNGIRRYMEQAVPEGASAETVDQVLAAFNRYYPEHSTEQTAPYPGIPELLQALRAAGMHTAVVSNKPDYAVRPLCDRYFPDMFDAAVGEREGVRRKPAPDAVEAVLRELGIPKEQAVYIGDSDVDIATAHNVGMDCISVTYGFRSETFLLAHGASVLADSAQELLEMLLV